MINSSMASLSPTDYNHYNLVTADSYRFPAVIIHQVLTMLVIDAAGAGEDAFPLCPGAGDLVIRCCLLTDRRLVRSSSTLGKEREAGLPRTSKSLSHCTNLQ